MPAIRFPRSLTCCSLVWRPQASDRGENMAGSSVEWRCPYHQHKRVPGLVGLRLLLEPLQQDRLRTVILDGDGVVFLVDRDLREERHLPRALAIRGDPKIDY